MTEDTKVAASDVLVALARSHFSFVLAELLAQLNAPGQISKEFVLITVGKLLSTNGTVQHRHPPSLPSPLPSCFGPGWESWDRKGSFPSPRKPC